MPLDERFKNFISYLPGSINMDGADGLDFSKIPVSRCDYYLNTPEMTTSLSLFEQKLLTEAEFSLAENAFARSLNEAIVAAGGKLDPDLSGFEPALITRLTKRVDRVVRSANRQLRLSAGLMGFPDGSYNGFLVLLNEAVEILGHDVLLRLCEMALAKRLPEGEARYPEINGVIIIDETPRLIGSNQGVAVYKPAQLCQRTDADLIGWEVASLWRESAPVNGAGLANSKSFLCRDWGQSTYMTSVMRSTTRFAGPGGMLLGALRDKPKPASG